MSAREVVVPQDAGVRPAGPRVGWCCLYLQMHQVELYALRTNVAAKRAELDAMKVRMAEMEASKAKVSEVQALKLKMVGLEHQKDALAGRYGTVTVRARRY